VVEAARVSLVVGSDKDVVCLAVLSLERDLSVALLLVVITLGDTHLGVAVLVDLKTSSEDVLSVVGGCNDDLLGTNVVITIPGTPTRLHSAVAGECGRLLAACCAREVAGDLGDALGVPAEAVVGVVVDRDGEREVCTSDTLLVGRDSDVVLIRDSVKDDGSVDTAIVIVGGDTDRCLLSLGIALTIDIDDSVTDLVVGLAGVGNELACASVDDKPHGVHVCVAALRVSQLQIACVAPPVEGKGVDGDGVSADTVGMVLLVLEGKDKVSTSVGKTSDKDIVWDAHLSVPGDQGLLVAGIVVVHQTARGLSLVTAVRVELEDSVKVGAVVAGVGHDGKTSTIDKVPHTAGVSLETLVTDRDVQSCVLVGDVGEVADFLCVVTAVGSRCVVISSRQVVSATLIVHTTNKDVVVVHGFCKEGDNRGVCVAAVVVGGNAVAVGTSSVLVAALEDSDDGVKVGPLIASVQSDDISVTHKGVPLTIAVESPATTLDRSLGGDSSGVRGILVGDDKVCCFLAGRTRGRSSKHKNRNSNNSSSYITHVVFCLKQ